MAVEIVVVVGVSDNSCAGRIEGDLEIVEQVSIWRISGITGSPLSEMLLP